MRTLIVDPDALWAAADAVHELRGLWHRHMRRDNGHHCVECAHLAEHAIDAILDPEEYPS